jgi:hypothetical protein
MTLQRALSKLIEKNEQGGDDDEENTDQQAATAPTTGGENTPTTKTGSNSSSSPSTPPGTPPRRKGVTKYPKTESERLGLEKAAAITSMLGESDITLAPPTITTATVSDISEKDTLQAEQEMPKKKTGRVSIFLQKDRFDLPMPATTSVSTDLRRQPSKAGVLSNLLKLQGIGRQQKVRRGSTPVDIKCFDSSPPPLSICLSLLWQCANLS